MEKSKGAGMKDKFAERVKVHDEFESKIMDVMRPFTTRKHLPDRFVSFSDRLYAWDAKTNIFVEKNSHDEHLIVTGKQIGRAHV